MVQNVNKRGQTHNQLSNYQVNLSCIKLPDTLKPNFDMKFRPIQKNIIFKETKQKYAMALHLHIKRL